MLSIKREVNPLNVADARRLSYIPSHFERMTLRTISVHEIDVWVYENLKSRYAIVKSLKLDPNNKLIEIQELGIEDPKELTILSLSCPYLER